METIKAKLALLRENKPARRRFIILAAAFVLLIAGLCISIGMHSNMHSDYAFAADHIEEQVYEKMTSMSELYSRIDDKNVDVQNKLIPELKAQYTALVSLNGALTDGFGSGHAILTETQIEAFDNAFAEYAAAYRGGSPTGLARADMDACMAEVNALLEIYNTPEDPVEPPVEITYGETPNP